MPINYKYFVGLGGNLGCVEQTFIHALQKISQDFGSVSLVSSLYQSKALQIDTSVIQNDYLNCVALIESKKSELEALDLISKIEFELGRVRVEKWGARNIDIDILAKDDLVFSNQDLQIPHPEMHKRSFVLQPLAEISPDWVHPILLKTAQDLFSDLQDSTLDLIQLNLIQCKILKPFPRYEF